MDFVTYLQCIWIGDTAYVIRGEVFRVLSEICRQDEEIVTVDLAVADYGVTARFKKTRIKAPREDGGVIRQAFIYEGILEDANA